jgi:hypothetical protein
MLYYNTKGSWGYHLEQRMQKSLNRFTTISDLQHSNVGVTFIIAIVTFYKMEAIRFIISCEQSSLFAVKEINSALHSIF